MRDKPRREPPREPRDEQFGPTREQVDSALNELLNHDIPGTPDVRAVSIIEEAFGFPVNVGGRRVLDASITKGRPRHGEMRSDDHIGSYEVEYMRDCPECPSVRAVFKYSAHHHIAGMRSITCRRCDHEYEYEEWA